MQGQQNSCATEEHVAKKLAVSVQYTPKTNKLE